MSYTRQYYSTHFIHNTKQWSTYHDFTGGVVGDGGRLGGQVLEGETLGQSQDPHRPLLGGLGKLQQALAHIAGEADGHVAEGLHAAYSTVYENMKNVCEEISTVRIWKMGREVLGGCHK